MENKDIELRSEQVRRIIGQVPPMLVRSGIGIIGLIVALLLAVAAFVPYPETADTDITLTGIRNGQAIATAELPYACITQINPGMKAEIELEGYTSKEYGYLQGTVTNVSPRIISRDGGEQLFLFYIVIARSSFYAARHERESFRHLVRKDSAQKDMGIDRYASTIFLGIFKKGTVEVIKLKSFPYSTTSINSYKFRLLGIHIFHQGFLFPNAPYNLCFHVPLFITCAIHTSRGRLSYC